MQQTAETILNAITIINPGNRGLVMAHRKVLETALLELSPGAQELFRTLLDEHLKQVQGTQISDDEQRTEASESTSSTLIEIHDPDEYSIDNPPDVDTILNTLYKLAVNGDNIAGQMLNVLNSNISQQNLQPITERAVKINTTALLNAEYRLLLLLGLYDKKIESPINTDDVEKFIKNHEYGHLVINDKNQTYNLLKQLEGWGIERTETSRRRFILCIRLLPIIMQNLFD